MNKRLSFSKMHGIGNDFMVLDCTRAPFWLKRQDIARLADRHFGVGFDQLLVVEKPSSPEMDFRYRIFNADGGEVEQCGNGARCFAVFVYQKGLTDKKTIQVETRGGNLVLQLDDKLNVRVDMGLANFEPQSLPMNFPTQQPHYSLYFEQKEYRFCAVSLGNPHAVFIVEQTEGLDIEPLARFVQQHEYFPNSVNVGFMQIVDHNNIRLRVYERGSGETLACGSGACAAVACGKLADLLDSRVKVELAGGTLLIEYHQDQRLFLSGPAQLVFDGDIHPSFFEQTT